MGDDAKEARGLVKPGTEATNGERGGIVVLTTP